MIPVARASVGDVGQAGFPEEVAFRLRSRAGRGGGQTRWGAVRGVQATAGALNRE